MAKSLLLANLSHEIRTSMGGIFGSIQLMQSDTLNSEQRSYLGILQAAGENLLAILDDTLDFSRIEAGKVEIRQEPFILRDQIEETVRIHRPRMIRRTWSSRR